MQGVRRMAKQQSTTVSDDRQKLWATRQTIAKLFDVSTELTKKYQYGGQWILGVHYTKLRPGSPRSGVRFNPEAISHFFATRHDPRLHEAWCQRYLAQLESPANARQSA